MAVFAHNEEGSIGDLIDSLRAQTLFARSGVSGEVRILENGSTDRTAEVAEVALESWAAEGWGACVDRISPGGKARTWNEYVHRLADPAAEVLVFLDADIDFRERTVLESLIGELEAHPKAVLATDTPLKVFPAAGAKGGARERLSASAG